MAPSTMPTTKRCSKCGEEKPLAAFHRAPPNADGHRGQCIKCRLAYNVAWKKANPGKIKLQTAAQSKRYMLKRRYRITPELWLALLEAQGFCCAICRTDSAGGRYNTFAVDHCHVTGRVRGLLCHKCNWFLGKVGDDLTAAQRIVAYLGQGANHG